MCAPDEPVEHVDHDEYMSWMATDFAEELHRFIGIEIKRCAVYHQGQCIVFDCEEIALSVSGPQGEQFGVEWSPETSHTCTAAFVSRFTDEFVHRFAEPNHVMTLTLRFQRPALWPFTDDRAISVVFPHRLMTNYPILLTGGIPVWRVAHCTGNVIELREITSMHVNQ